MGKLFLFSVFCRKRNLLFLFSLHFLFSLKLFMLFQTCNFVFLALRHFLITKQFHGITTFLYKNIVVPNAPKTVVGLPGFEPGSRTPEAHSLDQTSRQPLCYVLLGAIFISELIEICIPQSLGNFAVSIYLTHYFHVYVGMGIIIKIAV